MILIASSVVACLLGSLWIWCTYRGSGEKAPHGGHGGHGDAGKDSGKKRGHSHGNGEMHYGGHGDKGPSESLVKNEH